MATKTCIKIKTLRPLHNLVGYVYLSRNTIDKNAYDLVLRIPLAEFDTSNKLKKELITKNERIARK